MHVFRKGEPTSMIVMGAGVFALAVYAGCSSATETGTGTDAGAGSDTALATEDAATVDTGAVIDAATDSAPGTPREFGDSCSANAQCKSGVCFMGGNGSYCSFKCTPGADAATDCPQPLTSGECNNRGFCKK